MEQTTYNFPDGHDGERVSQIEMEYTFGINRPKSNECSGTGEYEHGTRK